MGWVSMANRRKLLLTWLSYNPHAMIAIGDRERHRGRQRGAD